MKITMKRKSLYLFIVVSFIFGMVLNVNSPITGTWSLMLIPAIGFIILYPSWVKGISFFLIILGVKYTSEFILLGDNLTLNIIKYHLITSFVNILVFIAISYLIIEYHKHIDKLTDKLNKDPMTGAYNRRFLKDYYRNLPKENTNILLLMDIDHFKKINDTYGHGFGDFVLKRVVKLINKSIVEYDGILVRFGGEEFAVIIPNINRMQGKIIAEQIRTKIENHKYFIYKRQKRVDITVSIGMTEFKSMVPLHDVMNITDEVLYISKGRGRNRVTVNEKFTILN